MVVFSSFDKLTAGVPLGGIGAGKVEINNKGKMVNLTIANNWGNPIPWMRGFHVLIRPDDSEAFFIERNLPTKELYGLEADEMTYIGEYPFATIRAKKGTVAVSMEAFSPMVPGNLRESSIPAVGITLRVDGSKSGKTAVALSNIAGTNATGRINEKVNGGVKFTNPHSNDYDGRRGDTCLLAASPSQTYVQYNFDVSPGVALLEKKGKLSYESEEPWLSIVHGKEFADDRHELVGQWEDAGGLVLADYHGGTETRYVFSWYFTGKSVSYPYGHYYHETFDGSEEAGNHLLRNFDRLRQESLAWHTKLVRGDLPDWLKDAVINSTYTLSSNSWLDERGRFAMLEATREEDMRQLGAIASFTSEVASLPILAMFPDLQRGYLEMLAGNMREDGYVLHDFGIDSLDHPTGGGTYPPGWKDIGSVFILLVYGYFRRTRETEFLAKMYPKMTSAVGWLLKQDRDGDGLPDAEGTGDGGFDAIVEKGRDSYFASMFIAALTATRETAKLLGRSQDIGRFSELISRAKQSFSELFNGRYFRAWTGEPDSEGYLFLPQLAGDWWTTILDLEPVADKEMIESAYNQLFDLNAQVSRFGTPNMVHESGRIWDISVQAYSSMPRLVFFLAGARFKAGDKRWLEVTRKEWNNLIAHGLAWDQPSRIDSRTGNPDPETSYLDRFIGSPALWSFNQ